MMMCTRRLFCSTTVTAARNKNFVKIIECPRDAIQGIKEFIPTENKVKYLKKLLTVGYDTLDCVSFVPAKIVPQLQDSEEVLKQIAPLVATHAHHQQAENATSRTKLLAVIANVRGAAKALQMPALSYVGYPLSASETFQKRNTNRTIAEALVDISEMQKLCTEAATMNDNNSKNNTTKQLGVCISMAFGNPYNENVTGADVRELCIKLYELGVPVIYFADTVGSGSPDYIAQVYADATRGLQEKTDVEFGIHLHSTPHDAEAKLEAVLNAGCRRFDGALFGLGGCPFAQNNLVGNIPSETIVKVANRMGFEHGIDEEKQMEAREALFEMLPHLRSAESPNA